jgi:RNA polymerase sigma-70 factor (ECF subfamily)
MTGMTGGKCSRMDQPELVWLTQYREGDVEAMGKLVEHYRRPLFGFILRMTEGRGDADEIFQDVWIRVIKSQHRYTHKNFKSWLFRIAHNLVIDRARKKKADVSLQDETSDGMTRQDKVASGGLAPDRTAGARDLGGRIQEAVSALPLLQREVFLMRTEGQLTFKEIASIQKVSLNTALGRMHYATTRLRDVLADDYRDHRVQG